MPEAVKEKENETFFKPLASTLPAGFLGLPVQTTPIDATDRYMVNLKVKVNEDHTVVPDESDLVDLVELIQTYKDQCGMELAKRLIKIGQAEPQDFADDGQHSVDVTQFPQTTQEASNMAVAAGKQVEAMRQEFDIPEGDVTGSQLEALLNAYFAKHPEYIKQPKTEVNE